MQSPVRTGSIEVTKNGSKTVTETELIYGRYYVYELTGEDGTPIISGNSGTHNKIDNTIYNVTGSGTSAIVGDTAGSVYLTNNKETVNKEATKTWFSEEQEHPTIYFKLFYNDGDNATEVIGAEPKELKNDTTKVTWNDLPKYDEDGNEYLYLVKEFIKDGENLVEAAPYGYVKAESGLSVTNTQSKTQIGVLKVDKTDSTPLTGAKFILKRYSADNYQGVAKRWPEQEVSAEESTKGTLSFSDLIVGYYELEESESPAGYIKTGENPRFEVTADAQGALHVNFTNSDMVTYKNGVFTVSNSPGVALPATGGPGTRFFTILGSILILGAGILLWRRRRIV